jgi:hypothetical protein
VWHSRHTARIDMLAVEAFRKSGVSSGLFYSYGNNRGYPSKIYVANRYAASHLAKLGRDARGKIMETVAEIGNEAAFADGGDNSDFSFLPQTLVGQCRNLIEGYHELHGYACLPDILWKARLGTFIETHREFRPLLRKASTTRSAKKANEGFATIATTLLSLEILASGFAGWSTLYPQAASRCHAMLQRNARAAHAPLMEFYLYPPKYISPAILATLAPPATNSARDARTDLAASGSGQMMPT